MYTVQILFLPEQVKMVDRMEALCKKRGNQHPLVVGSKGSRYPRTIECCVCSLNQARAMVAMALREGLRVEAWPTA